MRIELSNNGNYRLVLVVNNIQSTPGLIYLEILSQWLGARNGSEEQTKAGFVVNKTAIAEISEKLGSFK